VPEENFWTLWCKGGLTQANTPTVRLGATPSRQSSAHLHHPPFFTGRMPFLPPTVSKHWRQNYPLTTDQFIFASRSRAQALTQHLERTQWSGKQRKKVNRKRANTSSDNPQDRFADNVPGPDSIIQMVFAVSWCTITFFVTACTDTEYWYLFSCCYEFNVSCNLSASIRQVYRHLYCSKKALTVSILLVTIECSLDNTCIHNSTLVNNKRL